MMDPRISDPRSTRDDMQNDMSTAMHTRFTANAWSTKLNSNIFEIIVETI
jgi:hypothetical protein